MSGTLTYPSLLFISVPFDEDDKDKTVWFLDHDYLENMSAMFKKVNGETSYSSIEIIFPIDKSVFQFID